MLMKRWKLTARKEEPMPPLADAEDLEYAVGGEALVARRALSVQFKEDDLEQQ